MEKPNDFAPCPEDTVYGRNPVTELIKSGASIEKLFIQSGEREGSIKLIEALASKNRIPTVTVPRQKLDRMCGGGNHQGVAAISSGVKYYSVEDVLEYARSLDEKPLIVICDGVNDPRNLGAILRNCEGAGVHGVIIPKRHSATVNAAAIKASAGAAEHVKICKVSNLAETAEKLKKQGLWLFGCEAGGKSYLEADFTLPSAVVLGSEESGISRLLKEKCDFVVSIPMMGKVNSLNVSCAAAVILYRALAQRNTNN